MRLDSFVRADEEVLQPGVRCSGNYGQDSVERDGTERVEFVLGVAVGFGMLDVGQVHAVHAEDAETSIADGAAVIGSLRNAKRAVVAGPGSLVASIKTFLELLSLSLP